jgi:hypothetical protein
MFGYMNYKIENAHLARLLKIERTNTNRDFRFSQDLGEHAKVSWSQWQCVIAMQIHQGRTVHSLQGIGKKVQDWIVPPRKSIEITLTSSDDVQ